MDTNVKRATSQLFTKKVNEWMFKNYKHRTWNGLNTLKQNAFDTRVKFLLQLFFGSFRNR